MSAYIFLDLDNTLVRSYSNAELGRSEVAARMRPLCKQAYGDIWSIPRPKVKEFLEGCNKLADTYIFTAAQLGYAKSVVRAMDLHKYFKGYYTTYKETPESISRRHRLTSWVHVDDLSPDDPMALYKLNCLGLTWGAEKDSRLVARHYVRVEAYQPHLVEESNHLMAVLEQIDDKLRRNRKVL